MRVFVFVFFTVLILLAMGFGLESVCRAWTSLFIHGVNLRLDARDLREPGRARLWRDIWKQKS